MNELNLYVGVFEVLAVDENNQDVVGRFSLVVHAGSAEQASDLFSKYMDDHESDKENPIVGLVYESTVIEITQGASIPVPLRFDQVNYMGDLLSEQEISYFPDEATAGNLVTAYTLHDEENDDRFVYATDWAKIAHDKR